MTGQREVTFGVPQTAPRTVTAIAYFSGEPGRDQDVALAWAFELKYEYARGVDDPPTVTYSDGIYTVSGIIRTTHPADAPTTVFASPGAPWDLDLCLRPKRQARVRAAYTRRRYHWDGSAPAQ